MSHTHMPAFSGSVTRLCREGLSPVVFSPEVAAEPEIPGNRTLLGSFPGESPRGWGASDGGGSPVGQTRTRAPGGRCTAPRQQATGEGQVSWLSWERCAQALPALPCALGPRLARPPGLCHSQRLARPPGLCRSQRLAAPGLLQSTPGLLGSHCLHSFSKCKNRPLFSLSCISQLVLISI